VLAALGALSLIGTPRLTGAQQASAPSDPGIVPREATALEGVPTVRVETTTDGTTRRPLTAEEAARHRLSIQHVDGRFYWTSRQGQPLALRTSGDFTYLSSADPGQYIRFRRINDRIAYVEHVDVGFGSVSFWGELRIAVGK
jgi:hypothetical protein